MQRILLLICGFVLAAVSLPAANVSFVPGNLTPPAPMRELRGAWIATVVNIDWPSKPGLPVAKQKAEMISLLDLAKQLHLNAIFFQVRSVCDAVYASPLEPWSAYLTGVQGKMPRPFYDPLKFTIKEAHERGLQLYAWFNPFRAAHLPSLSPAALNHITRTHPELVRHYGNQVWLDPGEPASRARALAVVLDVVRRYNVDGVVFDDYFYPYPQKSRSGATLNFPDDASWDKYGKRTGLSRDDWRRANINHFIEKVSGSIKSIKPYVQFGVSPFGIWRPGVPAGISRKALGSYDNLYADSRKWLMKGWVDFLIPQLYWPIEQRDLSFPVLLKWWHQQNPLGRHVWAGINDAAVGTRFSTDEIARQIQIVRQQSRDPGEVHYHLRSITDNPALAAVIRREYTQPALVPASPWLGATPPDRPRLTVTAGRDSLSVRWQNRGDKPARWWVLQTRSGRFWQTEILPAETTVRYFAHPTFNAISIRAVDRLGNLSAPVVMVARKN